MRRIRVGELHRGKDRHHQTMNKPTGLVARAGARSIVPLRFFVAAVTLVALLFLAAQAAQGQSHSESGIRRPHAGHLRHEIDLSEWFAQLDGQKEYTKE